MADLPVTLRRATAQDAAAFARQMGDPTVYPGTMQLPYPSEEIWHARLTDNMLPARSHDIVLVAEHEGRLVGSAGLHPQPQLRRRHTAMLGITIVGEAQGQGVGRTLMQALCDYADDWAQVLRIELTVYADNARAIALYERFGFEHEGRLRGYALRKGTYEDVLAMARWHPQPPQRRVLSHETGFDQNS